MNVVFIFLSHPNEFFIAVRTAPVGQYDNWTLVEALFTRDAFDMYQGSTELQIAKDFELPIGLTCTAGWREVIIPRLSHCWIHKGMEGLTNA